MDEGVLILRSVFALLVLGHATQKLFGWFRGLGVVKHAPLFEASGLKPGKVFVVMAALTEVAGAVLLLTGFLTPLGATMILATMIVAIVTLWPKGLWGHLGGYEVALTYAVVMVALLFSGPGVYSLDHVLGLHPLFDQVWVAPAGIALAILGSLPLAIIIVRHRARQEATGTAAA
jgi:putative oxidoreductase